MTQLNEGETYIIRVAITNASTRGGQPCEATLTLGVYADGDIAAYFPLNVVSRYFSAGQTRSSDYPLSVPAGAGGDAGSIHAVVSDPERHVLDSADAAITIAVAKAATTDAIETLQEAVNEAQSAEPGSLEEYIAWAEVEALKLDMIDALKAEGWTGYEAATFTLELTGLPPPEYFYL